MLSCETSVSDVGYVDGNLKMSDRVNVSNSAVPAVVIFSKEFRVECWCHRWVTMQRKYNHQPARAHYTGHAPIGRLCRFTSGTCKVCEVEKPSSMGDTLTSEISWDSYECTVRVCYRGGRMRFPNPRRAFAGDWYRASSVRNITVIGRTRA